MLEARAHNQLKSLLKRASFPWPHNLTLSRLVARSLRRKDKTLIQLDSVSQDFWWLGLLVPLCLESSDVVLILSAKQRSRLLNVELPRLKAEGLNLQIWEGFSPPLGGELWIVDHVGLLQVYQHGFLKSRQLVFPGAEHLSESLRDALAVLITSKDWGHLRRANPSSEHQIIQFHERLRRRLFSQATCVDAQVRMDCSEIFALKDLLGLLVNSPSPWPSLLNAETQSWASWADLDHKNLNWAWHFKPLEPLSYLKELLIDCPCLLITGSSRNPLLVSELDSISFLIDVQVTLGAPNLQEPISLFAPRLQPLPNTKIFAEHLLDQCRRLILSRTGISMVLLDDRQMRYQLTSELAAEFGLRVVHEVMTPDSNGVICCRWSWWLDHHDQLPIPEQLIVALLPFASLESPLTAARVEALKRQGRDWFRELLLPEALNVFLQAVAPIREKSVRLAILDGRLRGRTWGEEFLHSLEPWTPLQRLLPN